MYLYIELWNAKASWLALGPDPRAAFMKKVDALLNELMSDDVKLIGCTMNDGSTTPRLDYRYVAVWQMKDVTGTHKVADGTARIGWYEYFDQVNIGGDWVNADALVNEMMTL
jgi:hypothetical protein